MDIKAKSTVILNSLFIFIFSFFTQISLASSISIQEKQSSSHSPWSFSYFGLYSQEFDSIDKGGGRLSSYNYITSSYRLDGDNKVAFRLPFSINSAGFDDFNGNANQEQEALLQDFIISYTDYNLILLPLDIGVYWEARWYLPTSKFSRDTKMISRFRNDFIFSKYLTSRNVFEYTSKFNYYQSQSVYKNDFTDENGFDVSVSSRTKRFYHDHWLSYWYRFSHNFSLGFLTGWEDTYYNKSSVNEGRNKPGKHEYKIGPQVAFELSSNANFIFQISDNVINDENRDELGQFKTENAEMTLLAFVRF